MRIMQENSIKAVWHILDLICGDEYLKDYFQKRLLKRNPKEWNVIDLLLAFRKIVNQIDEFDGQEIDVAIIQEIRIEK